jgi:hypothetical protein
MPSKMLTMRKGMKGTKMPEDMSPKGKPKKKSPRGMGRVRSY